MKKWNKIAAGRCWTFRQAIGLQAAHPLKVLTSLTSGMPAHKPALSGCLTADHDKVKLANYSAKLELCTVSKQRAVPSN